MKCPHCEGILPSIKCEFCGGETPEESIYCYLCGNLIKRESPKIDISERIPCSDGNCVGTINEDGVCSICKKPYREDLH